MIILNYIGGRSRPRDFLRPPKYGPSLSLNGSEPLDPVLKMVYSGFIMGLQARRWPKLSKGYPIWAYKPLEPVRASLKRIQRLIVSQGMYWVV